MLWVHTFERVKAKILYIILFCIVVPDLTEMYKKSNFKD